MAIFYAISARFANISRLVPFSGSKAAVYAREQRRGLELFGESLNSTVVVFSHSLLFGMSVQNFIFS